MVEDFAERQDAATDDSEAAARERSTIAFPYQDQDTAIEVARKLHNDGGGQGDLDSLAAWMGHDSSRSGGFRTKVYTARDFGLVEIERDHVRLLPLGRAIADPAKEAAARVDAFLHVPLYVSIYDAYKGSLLPRDIGLENKMRELGVASKQAKKARQVFARSAEQAGFFAYGADRLVKPVVAGEAVPPLDIPPKPSSDGREPPPPPQGSVKTVDLQSGGRVSITLSIDLVALSKADRDFVFGLIDSLNDYEDTSALKQLPVASAPVAPSPEPAEQDAV